MSDEQQHALGKDVTATFKAGQSKDTVVLSVRLQQSEFKALEQLASLEGKTVSQIARESVTRELTARNWPLQGFTVHMLDTEVTFGSPPTTGTFGQVAELDPNDRPKRTRKDFMLVD